MTAGWESAGSPVHIGGQRGPYGGGGLQKEQLWARSCASACWWRIRYSYSTSQEHRVGVSLLILYALRRDSLRCCHIVERLLLWIHGRAINKIISSVTKYFSNPLPSLCPSPRAPSCLPSRTKKAKDGG